MTTHLKTKDIIEFYKVGADEYFEAYVPFVLSKVKKWISNNSLSAYYHYSEIDYIKIDALSFAYDYYEDLKNTMFEEDIVGARKYWIRTIWVKMLDYLNANYLNIDVKNKKDPYKRNLHMSLESFQESVGSSFLYEVILSEHHTPSAELLLIEEEEQELPILLYKKVIEFIPKQYAMHNYIVPEDVYIEMIHDCLESALNNLATRTISSNDRAANLKMVSEKHDIPRKRVNMYYARFKQDVREYLWFIPIYLREKYTPKKL